MKADRRYSTPRWQRLRRRVLAQAGGRCSTPGCARTATLVHHRHHVRDGGPFYALWNVEALCGSCHQREHPRKMPAPPKRPITHNPIDPEWDAVVRQLIEDAGR